MYYNVNEVVEVTIYDVCQASMDPKILEHVFSVLATNTQILRGSITNNQLVVTIRNDHDRKTYDLSHNVYMIVKDAVQNYCREFDPR